MYLAGIIIVIIIAAVAYFVLDYLGEKTNNPVFSILGFFLPIVVIAFGFCSVDALADVYTADKVNAAVEKGYVVYVDGQETDPADIPNKMYIYELVKFIDDAREVHVATRSTPRDKEDAYDTVYVNGTKVDKNNISLELYKNRMTYDKEERAVYIVTGTEKIHTDSPASKRLGP